MAWSPIALTVPQYEDSNGNPYSGAVLKAYTAGTSTPATMATDSAGGTTAGSIALNASGYPAVSGNVVIPHVSANYKLCLYPTQAAADANSGALWTIDNLSPISASTGAAQVGFIQAVSGAVARTVSAKLQESVSAEDIGLVPNDATKRAANTAALEAALAVGSGCSTIIFPDTSDSVDTYYFTSFTVPQKPICLSGFATQRGNSNTILDFLPSGTVCVDASTGGGGTLNRFSRIENLIFTEHTPAAGALVKTMFYVNNGGLMMKNVWVVQCNIGIHFGTNGSYSGNYDTIGISATTACIYSATDIRNNYFRNLAVNNATRDSTNVAGGCTGGKGVQFAAGGLAAENTFINLDCSSCDHGVHIASQSRGNVFLNFYAENNITANRFYVLGGATQLADTWIEKYYGSDYSAPTSDVVPTNGTSADVCIIDIYYGNVTTRSVSTPKVQFPATAVSSSNVNTLDDYEEGTWEPVLSPGGGTITMDAANSAGTYTKVGRCVHITGTAVVTSVSSPTGNVSITGLPFTSSAGALSVTAGSVLAYTMEATMSTVLLASIGAASSSASLQKTDGAGGLGAVGPDIKAGTTVTISIDMVTDT